jgi:hypothetical protein
MFACVLSFTPGFSPVIESIGVSFSNRFNGLQWARGRGSKRNR